MSARLQLCFAAILLIATAGSAGADSPRSSTGSTPASSDTSGAQLPSGAAAYNQAAITDPYNQSDFSPQQTFSLTASQMLGAAAACEQLHSDLVSMRGQQTVKTPSDSSDEDRAALDAAQQHMLDPAATSSDASQASEADCDRMSGSFSQLQQVQLHDQDLAKGLDQPGGVSPSATRKSTK
ncbi:MAG TPA: hypothetical protein VGF92_05940 [Stellaceae bacterium]|jgi:hypothetical protein